jgi:hypothetical protein
MRRYSPKSSRPKAMDSDKARLAFDKLTHAAVACANAAELTLEQTLVAAFGEATIDAAKTVLEHRDYAAAARRIYKGSGTHDDGDINFDIDPEISKADGRDFEGAYVQAWVWVPKEAANA